MSPLIKAMDTIPVASKNAGYQSEISKLQNILSDVRSDTTSPFNVKDSQEPESKTRVNITDDFRSRAQYRSFRIFSRPCKNTRVYLDTWKNASTRIVFDFFRCTMMKPGGRRLEEFHGKCLRSSSILPSCIGRPVRMLLFLYFWVSKIG